MTKLEVISDAIKIGLPTLLGGLIAAFTFWATRSHEREKERRRRRQDALEKVSDDFQAACFSLADLAVKYSVYRELQNDPAPRRVAAGNLFESGGAIDAATKDLHLIGGRLKLLRLEECEQAFDEFLNQTIAFRMMLKLPPDPMATDEMLRQELNKVKALQAEVERSLGDAFNSL